LIVLGETSTDTCNDLVVSTSIELARFRHFPS
jgi:hypothetical protein